MLETKSRVDRSDDFPDFSLLTTIGKSRNKHQLKNIFFS